MLYVVHRCSSRMSFLEERNWLDLACTGMESTCEPGHVSVHTHKEGCKALFDPDVRRAFCPLIVQFFPLEHISLHHGGLHLILQHLPACVCLFNMYRRCWACFCLGNTGWHFSTQLSHLLIRFQNAAWMGNSTCQPDDMQTCVYCSGQYLCAHNCICDVYIYIYIYVCI